MLTPSVFGTEIELLAASEIYNFDYCIFPVYGNDYICRNSTAHRPASNLKLFLLCSGSDNAKHFCFLRPISPRNPGFINEGNYKRVDSRGRILIRK